MPANAIMTCDELIKLLEIQRSAFTDFYRPILPPQDAKLRKADELIVKDAKSLNQHQKKAHGILTNIKENHGDEVYLLCALATTISALGFSQLGDFVTNISQWWVRVEHLQGLTLLVEKRYGVSYGDMRHVDDLSDQRAAEPPHPSLNASLDRPASQPKVSRMPLTLADLLNFLQQYEDKCPTLQIACPWDGYPLPSISADLGLGLNLRVEMSCPMSGKFFAYLCSKATPEVA